MVRNREILRRNEQGFVLVIALIVLLVATVVGVFAIQNTSIDTKISGNERIATLLFNAADAGADAAVSWFKTNTVEGGKKLTADNPATAPVGTLWNSYWPLGTSQNNNNNNNNSMTYYNFEVDPMVKSSPPPPGFSAKNYKRYYYLIKAVGKVSGAKGTKEVDMEISRVFQKNKS